MRASYCSFKKCIEEDRISAFWSSRQTATKSRDMDKYFFSVLIWCDEPEAPVIKPFGGSPFLANVGQNVSLLCGGAYTQC